MDSKGGATIAISGGEGTRGCPIHHTKLRCRRAPSPHTSAPPWRHWGRCACVSCVEDARGGRTQVSARVVAPHTSVRRALPWAVCVSGIPILHPGPVPTRCVLRRRGTRLPRLHQAASRRTSCFGEGVGGGCEGPSPGMCGQLPPKTERRVTAKSPPRCPLQFTPSSLAHVSAAAAHGSPLAQLSPRPFRSFVSLLFLGRPPGKLF